MKTARFTDVVQKAGAPKSYLLWVPPKQDPVFRRALKEQRILTIHQENVGTKKDYGEVGFHEAPTAQFLVFPKSLKTFIDRRIVGINYDLLAQDTPKARAPATERKAPKERAINRVKPQPAAKTSTQAKREEAEEKILAFEIPSEKSEPAAKEPAKQAKASKAERTREAQNPVESRKPEKPAEPETPAEPEKPAEPEQPARKGKAAELDKMPPPEKATTARSAVEARLLFVVRRAMRDLDTGKTVAAYKKLEALIAEADKRAED